MGRRVREWPRLVAAVAVAAVLLVLIGVVVASAGSGGTKTVSAKPAAAVTSAPRPAASNADKQQVAKLRSELRRQSAELTAARKALSASKARTRCWRTKARHPKKERTVQCPTGSFTH
jgi:Skp family chaperone for outer membrane proteins